MDAAASEICYAASGYAPIPPISWPGFVRDRPKPGTTVTRDAPLCTLFATGPDSAATRAMLRGRAAELRTCSPDGGTPMTTSPSGAKFPFPSVNALTAPLVERLVADAEALRLSVTTENGARMVDAGASVRGSIEAGRRIAEICLGGLGTVSIAPAGPVASWPYSVIVHAADPVIACLGSQYAGWSLADETGDSASSPSAPAPAGPSRWWRISTANSATGTPPPTPPWCWRRPAARRPPSSPRWPRPRASRPSS